MARGYPDFEGGKSGLYLIPEWAAKEGKDKNFSASAIDKAYYELTSVSYLVPTGKILYITDVTWEAFASDVANADNNQFCTMLIGTSPPTVYHLNAGSNGGGSIQLACPLVIPAGQTLACSVFAMANHNMDIGIRARGFEL